MLSSPFLKGRPQSDIPYSQWLSFLPIGISSRSGSLTIRRLMLPGVDAITDDAGLAQRLGGLKPVQALDQHEARAVHAH